MQFSKYTSAAASKTNERTEVRFRRFTDALRNYEFGLEELSDRLQSVSRRASDDSLHPFLVIRSFLRNKRLIRNAKSAI